MVIFSLPAQWGGIKGEVFTKPVKTVAILYHPKVGASETLASELASALRSMGARTWMSSAWEEDQITAQAAGTDLALSVGGDGTILRSARALAPFGAPILGINLGRLGFMTELMPAEARQKLAAILDGEGWIEERAMLQAEPLADRDIPTIHALNDVVVARGGIARAVYLSAVVNGEKFVSYKADGLIVSTATGSTAYSLAVGGAVLHPESSDLMMTPIAPHLMLANSVVLPGEARMEVRVSTDHQAILSIDGQIEFELKSGHGVRLQRSPYVTRFLRLRSRDYFYGTFIERLKYREGEQNPG